jgi:hypothetical protein
MNISQAAKAWTALSVGGLAWGAEVVASAPSQITSSEWLGAAGVLVAAVGVFFMPNTTPAPPGP